MKAPLPPAEPQRLAALRRYDVLDTPPEAAFDDLTALAAHICEAPIALITLVDEQRQWFKSRVGLDLAETSRDVAFCAHAIHQSELFVIPDATRDPRFADNALVTAEPHIRFYAGAPLVTPEGHALGTLCVIDRVPRELRPEHEQALRVLSRYVMTQLEHRRRGQELAAAREALSRHQEREAQARGQIAAEARSRRALLSVLEDQRRVEQALRESEGRLRLALEAAHMGTFDWDVPNDRIAWSRWHDELWGFRPGEFGGTYAAFAERVHRDDLPGIDAEVARCVAAREPFAREFRVVWPDGSVHWVMGRGEFAFDAGGQPLRMRGVVLEITERRQAEAALRSALARFETLFRAAPEAMSISELASGRLLEVNDAFCAMFGFARDELIGRTSLELNLWVRPEARGQLLDELRARGRVVATGGQVRTRTGELRDAQFSAARIDFGGSEGLLLMFVDVTERARAQRQVLLHEQQLKELAQRLMTKEEEERKALAQTLHDRFAQNLAAAKLGLEGALMGVAAPSPDLRRLQAALRRAIASLDESITDVRGVLAELRPPLLGEFGLRPALRQEIESRRALAGATEVVLGPAPPAAVARSAVRLAPAAEYGLFMIAREALANALLHARATRIEVDVAFDAARALVRVSDNGVGFDPARAQEGGHLGLTGMRERAALIGAALAIDSAPGHGTTVTATLPLGADAASRER